jgi:uncharacterized protein (DUF302 family)
MDHLSGDGHEDERSGGSGLTVIIDGSIDAAGSTVRDALRAEGFGVLTEIDVEATLREKLGDGEADEVGPTRILGACNPGLAHRALTTERDVAMLLPCNVVLREMDGRTEVSVADPSAMVEMVGASLSDVAHDARGRLERVIAALGG